MLLVLIYYPESPSLSDSASAVWPPVRSQSVRPLASSASLASGVTVSPAPFAMSAPWAFGASYSDDYISQLTSSNEYSISPNAELLSTYPTTFEAPTGSALELFPSTLGMPASASRELFPVGHNPMSMAETYAADAPHTGDLYVGAADMMWPQNTYPASPSPLHAYSPSFALFAPIARSSVTTSPLLTSSPFERTAAASSTHTVFYQPDYFSHEMPQQRESLDFASHSADVLSEASNPFDPTTQSFGDLAHPTTVLVEQWLEQQRQHHSHIDDVPFLPHSLYLGSPHNPVRSMSATADQLPAHLSPRASPLRHTSDSYTSQAIPSESRLRVPVEAAVQSKLDRQGDCIGDQTLSLRTTASEPTQEELDACDRQCIVDLMSTIR